jgi:molybdopterin/thiamine biosynthesis adenylyltransferase/rhodanese-related sulfurtransferase
VDKLHDNSDNPRYIRQVTLGAFGVAGQERLLGAKVLVVGAGGLGCAALPYLAGAGIGTIGIVDDDRVAVHNLHRQVLYTMEDIGRNKAATAAQRLQQLNPDIRVQAFSERLTVTNTLDLFAGFDLVIDGTDNFPTRYMINDACMLLGKPLVYGSVSGMEGQVAVFCTPGEDGSRLSYRDLFPDQPGENEFPNCAAAGVLGVLPAIIGSLQATEAIKFLAKLGRPLVNRLLTCNLNEPLFLEIDVQPNPEGARRLPVNRGAFRQMTYGSYCDGTMGGYTAISPSEFNELATRQDVLVVDVREKGEWPALTVQHIAVPLRNLPAGLAGLSIHTVVLVCQSGRRSEQAAKMLAEYYGAGKKIFTLAGGIEQLQQQ